MLLGGVIKQVNKRPDTLIHLLKQNKSLLKLKEIYQ
jgi:hypothetical protein